MSRHRGPRSPGWQAFLRNHTGHIAGIDLFVVPTVGFKLLYGLVILRLERRQLVWTEVTANPTAEWIARQITEAFPWDEAPRYLIRDRDTSYGAAVTRRLRAMGIRDRPITPRSPWQNGHVERLIGSIRRECLDHVVVLGKRHLRHLLANYAAYYNGVRTHLALDKDTPFHRPVQTVGRIASVTWLGGLYRYYVGTAQSVGTGYSHPNAKILDTGSCQLVEQRLCLFEIGRAEAFGEPAIDGGEKVAGFGMAALVAAETGEAHGGAQFPELGSLLSGDAQGIVIEFLGGLDVPLAQQQLALVPVEFGREPALFCSFHDP